MKPSIAQIITRMIPGGASRVVHQLVSGLSNRYEIDLLTGTDDLPDSLHEDLPNSVDLKTIPLLKRNIAPIDDLRALIHLIRIFSRENYDLIHTHTSKAGLLGRIGGMVAGKSALVHTPHGLIYREPEHIPGVPNSKFLRGTLLYLERFAGLGQDVLTALSEREAQTCEELGLSKPDQTHTVYNGIETIETSDEEGRSYRQKFGIDPDDILVVSVGRISPEKGYPFLLDAFVSLRENDDRLKLLIAGSGSDTQRLSQHTPDRYSEDIILPGYVEDVGPVYKAGDLYVLPSQYEGFGLSMVEAMNAGLPVVATKVGGIPEIIEDRRHGLLVEPGNSEELSNAIGRLIDEESLRKKLAQNALERSRDFTVDSMVENYREIYDNLLDTH